MNEMLCFCVSGNLQLSLGLIDATAWSSAENSDRPWICRPESILPLRAGGRFDDEKRRFRSPLGTGGAAGLSSLRDLRDAGVGCADSFTSTSRSSCSSDLRPASELSVLAKPGIGTRCGGGGGDVW
jgi:hypothetical protein